MGPSLWLSLGRLSLGQLVGTCTGSWVVCVYSIPACADPAATLSSSHMRLASWQSSVRYLSWGVMSALYVTLYSMRDGLYEVSVSVVVECQRIFQFCPTASHMFLVHVRVCWVPISTVVRSGWSCGWGVSATEIFH